jgi:hypothetical protein
METEMTAIEETLKSMKPVALSESTLDRMEGAMNQALDECHDEDLKIVPAPLTEELALLEESLRDLVPHGMPENMIGRLDEAMSKWHERVPLEEKVVPLKPVAAQAATSSRPGLRAVAAVALLGVGAAFLTTGESTNPTTVSQKIPVFSPGSGGNTTPVVFNPGDSRSSVVSTNDRGVVWTKEGVPVRCLEVEVQDEVHFVNNRGEELIISRPKREMMFTPLKLD